MKSSARRGEPVCRNGNELRVAMTRLLAVPEPAGFGAVAFGGGPGVSSVFSLGALGVSQPLLWHRALAHVCCMEPPCRCPLPAPLPGCQNVLWPLPAGPGLAGAMPAAHGEPRSEAKAGQADGRDGMHEASLLLGSRGGPMVVPWWSCCGPAAGLVDAQPQP